MWREIPSLPGYYASNDGSIGRYSDGNFEVLKSHDVSKYGHQSIGIKLNGKWKKFAVHRLVLEAFSGPCPKGLQCRHLDDNPRNNHIDNLVWGTAKENAEDKVRNKHHMHGEKHYNAVISEKEVIEIRRSWKNGSNIVELARQYGLTPCGIHDVCVGVSWKHVKEETGVTAKELRESRLLMAFNEEKTFDEWTRDPRCQISPFKLSIVTGKT